jgi:hypothetical protein
VLLSTRTTKGSTRFNGMSRASASALNTAQTHPAAATHHAVRALRRNCAARSASHDSASRKYSSIAGTAFKALSVQRESLQAHRRFRTLQRRHYPGLAD